MPGLWLYFEGSGSLHYLVKGKSGIEIHVSITGIGIICQWNISGTIETIDKIRIWKFNESKHLIKYCQLYWTIPASS